MAWYPAEEPIVSVVTPAYNEERYLRECIESVLAQTYTHWDYTIVNNCSTDRTLDIAQEYAARDPRIRIHNNETFVPVIANYNIAFRQISPRSKYCKVVGADDWIYPECLERMVRLAEENPTVAIVGAYTRLGVSLDPSSFPFASNVVSGRDVCRDFLLGRSYVFGAPTSLLFRADIVRSRPAFFHEPHLHADTEACFEFLEHRDFGFVHQVLTYTRVRGKSMTTYSKYYDTYLFGKLDLLIKYGPTYLDKKELKYRIRNQFSRYYDFLGSQVYKRRGREFWSFHRSRLAELGHRLNLARVLLNAIVFGVWAAPHQLRKRL